MEVTALQTRAPKRHRSLLGCISFAAVIVAAAAGLSPAAAADNLASPPVTPSDSEVKTDAVEGVETGGEPIALNLNEAQRRGSAEQCSDVGTDGVQSCVSLSDDTANRSVTPESIVEAEAASPEPDYCIEAGVQNTYYVTRFDSCGIFSATYTITRTTNGVTTTTGTMRFLIYNYLYAGGDVTTWANQIRVSPTVITGTAAGTAISGTAFCTGFCTPGSASFPTQTPGVGQSAEGESFYNWLGAPGDVGFGSSDWTLSFKAPTAPTTALLQQQAPDVRCDDAVPGAAFAGCVIPYAPGFIRFDGTTFIEFGAHVSNAQASGLPGSVTSTPLRRLTDATIRDQNRATACPSSYPRPTGKSCDECPFASSYEGAFTGGGTARTFDFCQITLAGPPSSGPLGFSVCMIDAGENSSAGSLLQSELYVPYRIIDGDEFYVDIV